MASDSQNRLLPSELLDKCRDQPIWVVMKNELEFEGILKGYDDYVNMVLVDVTQHDYDGETIKLKQILLNGNNICMCIPGSLPSKDGLPAVNGDA